MQEWYQYDSEATHFQSPEFLNLLMDYEKEIDPVKRVAKLAKCGEWQYKNWVTIPLVMATPVWAYNTEVVGYWPIEMVGKYENLDYIRHPKPLKTFRLFEVE